MILAGSVVAKHHEPKRSLLLHRHLFSNDNSNVFVGTLGKGKSIIFYFLLSIVDLASVKHRQKNGNQGVKGGDFLGGLLKKYYLNLDCSLVPKKRSEY